jgi:hypothetical protein
MLLVPLKFDCSLIINVDNLKLITFLVMKKITLKLSLVLFLCLGALNSFSQIDTSKTTIANSYSGKTYIFNQNFDITESKPNGNDLTSPAKTATALQGTRCYVTSVKTMANNKKYVVIKFYIWTMKISKSEETVFKNLLESKDARKKYLETPPTSNASDSLFSLEKRKASIVDILLKRQTFNFLDYAYMDYVPLTVGTTVDNVRYFRMLETDFNSCCIEYKKTQNWDINFGVLTTPFKLRVFGKFAFTNNVSIGTSIYIQKKLSTDWSWGLVGGLSLTSVTLDASSTNIYPDGTTSDNVTTTNKTPITTSSTRPAFTPSVSALITYKNISLTLGVGADYINKPTAIATNANPEAGWIYNGRPWIGIGFGVSLFNNSKPVTTTTPDATQSTDK